MSRNFFTHLKQFDYCKRTLEAYDYRRKETAGRQYMADFLE